jgi:hypothetical protein
MRTQILRLLARQWCPHNLCAEQLPCITREACEACFATYTPKAMGEGTTEGKGAQLCAASAGKKKK